MREIRKLCRFRNTTLNPEPQTCANQVVAGLLLHQTRSTVSSGGACAGRFWPLAVFCRGRLSLDTAPYGTDPAFDPTRSMYQALTQP